MPEYLATVRHPDGRKLIENVVAASADEAVRLLDDRGCTEVVLHNDDITAHFTRQREKAGQVTPGDYLLIRKFPRGLGLFLVVLRQGWRTMGVPLAAAGLVLAYSRWDGGPWTSFDRFGAAALLFVPALATVAVLFGHRTQSRYRAMMDALYWGRWEECLRRAEGIGPKVAAHEVPFRKAQALAGLDRLDEALRLVEPFGDGKAMPGWLYRSMLAQVYEFARKRDEAIAQLEHAVELAPDNATMYLALGRLILGHRRDARRARDLLDTARSHALSDLTAPYADQLEGMILLEEGQPGDAIRALEATRRIFQARRHQVLGYLPVEQATQGLALAHAALGASDEALRLYGQVRPRLVALRSGLLDRCDRAIGIPFDR